MCAKSKNKSKELIPAANPREVFSLSRPGERNLLLKTVKGPLEWLLGLQQLGQHYARVSGTEASEQLSGANFLDAALQELSIQYHISEKHLANIPKSGPVVIVCNHPFGGIEGIILGHLLKKLRPDVKIMANFLLKRIEELQDLFIFVDPFEHSAAQQNNVKPLKETIRWLQNGGALGVFPSGTVSHLHTDKWE